ncbi:VWA domain-containing protein [bacterium]|nr:VWA domain-containing protein [bacterium]
MNTLFLPGAWHLANPGFLWWLLLIPIFFLLRSWSRCKPPGILFPAIGMAEKLIRDPRQSLHHVIPLCRVLALVLLVLAMARPQGEVRRVERIVRALDIMLVLDLSESMRAYDIKPNRLAAAQAVLEKFIKERKIDRVGIVVFSGAGFTLMPLTTDYPSIIASLRDITTNTVRIEGTAIGEALLTAANRLLEAGTENSSENPSSGRVVILATDGVNNRGIDPVAAARILAEKGLKLYTISLGGERRVLRFQRNFSGKLVPLRDIYGRRQYWEKPDVDTLRRLAEIGGGQYFQAGNRGKLEEVLDQINKLEKRRVKIKHSIEYRELYLWPLAMALFFLGLERILARTRFRRF